jgi:16S rRNA (cytidine1402-2'-O)-methyltransferase
VRHGDLAALARETAAAPEPRGEIAIVIAPPDAEEEATALDLDTLIRAALARLSLKEAVAEVATVTGAARREVYQRALALAEDRDHER